MTRRGERKRNVSEDEGRLPEHYRKKEARFDKQADANTENTTKSGKGGKIRGDRMDPLTKTISKDENHW